MAFAWQYSDWRRRESYATDAARYDRLVLHIEEVSNYLLEIESQEDRSRTKQGPGGLSEYLKGLEAEASRLLSRLEKVALARPARTRVSFGSFR